MEKNYTIIIKTISYEEDDIKESKREIEASCITDLMKQIESIIDFDYFYHVEVDVVKISYLLKRG